MILGQFQFRRDTAANWSSVNPILLSGEFGLETDTDQFKIGDGTTAWNSLAYGGLQGPQGIQGVKGDPGRGIVSITRTAGNGAAGTTDTYTITYTEGPTSTFTVKNGSSVVVGTTNTVTPATNPSVTDADAGENVSLTFNLPRARNVTAGTTTTGAAGTSASVSSAQNGDGDVTLNFTIPRGDTGQTGPAAQAFTNIAVSGQTTVSAETTNDTLTLVAGTGISLTTDAPNDSITINSNISVPNAFTNFLIGTSPTPTSLTPDLAADTLNINAGTGITLTADAGTDTFTINNADTGSAARTAHEAAADPHPQYTTTAEASAAAPVQSVNGKTGAVSTIGDNAVTNTARSAAITTTVTTVGTFPIAGGSIAAGAKYRFEAVGLVTNTATATNLVATLAVGATAVITVTQALGTTARTSQPVQLVGYIHFTSATAAEGFIRVFTSAAVAFDTGAAPAAAVTVVTATATDVNLKINTSGASSTFTLTSLSIEKIK